MSDFIDISMIGDKQLQKKLSMLDFKIQRSIVKKSVNRSMLPVRDRAKQLVPRDTGRLAQSIRRKTKTKRGITRVSIVTGRRDELGISADDKGYYPAVIEYGIKGREAKSFLRKALTDLRHSVLNDTGNLIDAYIKKAVR